MSPHSSSSSSTALPAVEDVPDREGELFGPGVTRAALYDSARQEYLLYPEAPYAAEVIPDPDQRVAVIDSGVMRAHPQIAGLIVAERDWTGEGIEDQQGHGTMVALGILHGRRAIISLEDSLATFDSKVPALVIAKVAPNGKPLRLRDVIQAIHWSAAQKVRVVNLSLGFRGDPDDFVTLKNAIHRYPDILFMAAAGNYGPRIPVFPAAFGAKNMIVVGEASGESGKAELIAPTALQPIPAARHALWRHQEQQFRRAMLAARESRASESKHLFQEIAATAGHPHAAEAWIQLGLHAVAENDPSTALRHFHASRALSPATSKLLEAIASVHFNQGDFIAAEQNYRDSAALAPENPSARYMVGLSMLRQKKYRSALGQFEATHRLAPDHPDLEPILTDLRAAQARGELPPE